MTRKEERDNALYKMFEIYSDENKRDKQLSLGVRVKRFIEDNENRVFINPTTLRRIFNRIEGDLDRRSKLKEEIKHETTQHHTTDNTVFLS